MVKYSSEPRPGPQCGHVVRTGLSSVHETSFLDPAGPAILTQVFVVTDPMGRMGAGSPTGRSHRSVLCSLPAIRNGQVAWEGGWHPREGIAFPHRSPHCSGARLICLEQMKTHCAVMGSHTSWAGGLRVALECWLCCHGSRKWLFRVKRHQFLPPRSPPAGSPGSVMPGPHCRKLMSSAQPPLGQAGWGGVVRFLVTTSCPLVTSAL